jgi:hypothetical protein
MKNNLIPFPGSEVDTFVDDQDDFCGAAGFMFESGPTPPPALPQSADEGPELYAFERQITDRLHLLLNVEGQEQASISFPEPEALREEFKDVLLKVLARNKKVAHRNRRILTVSHPAMSAEEQVPFLKECSEIPQVTLRSALTEELDMMRSLRAIFPELQDARNAIGSSMAHTPERGLFFSY